MIQRLSLLPAPCSLLLLGIGVLCARPAAAQVGYDPDARARWAYVSGFMGDGGAVSLDGLASQAEVLAVHGGAYTSGAATGGVAAGARFSAARSDGRSPPFTHQ